MASTRRVILPMGGWANDGTYNGTFLTTGQNRLFTCADSVQSFMVSSFMMPKDWDGGNFTVYVRVREASTTGNAYITLLMDQWHNGQPSSSIINSANAVALSNSNANHAETSFTITGASFATTDNIGIRVGRLADNVLDTYNGANVYIAGVYIEYTSRNVTYTFSANTKIKSAEVNQNMQDLR